jgi:Do/DeqQ family serine protease
MKFYGIVIGSSLLSAFLAIMAYHWLVGPQEIIIRESVPSRYTNYSDDILEELRPRTFLSAAPTDFSKAAEAVTPAVVNIKSIQTSIMDRWRGSRTYGPASSGSGVIISPDGYIVTNHHVVEEGNFILVNLNDKREMKAKVIGSDPSTDMALLKVEAEDLPYLEFGNSDSLNIGEWVLAVGNPFDLASTVTAGIVSAKGRSIDILEGTDRIESFIQTDAAVNPGNSGGALVNTNGELIGINTAIITQSGRYEGYSFAIPANLARKVVRDLREYGVVQRGVLGVFIENIDQEIAEELGLPNVEGVYVTRVTPGSGADESGMKKGDVILAINGIKTKTLPEMQEQLGRYRPGNLVRVEYFRRGEVFTKDMLLKNKTNNTAIITADEHNALLRLGFDIRELTKDELRVMGVQGVKVVSIVRGSIIAETKMDQGFIITRVNDRRVSDVKQFMRLLDRARGQVMLSGIYEEFEGEYYYVFEK